MKQELWLSRDDNFNASYNVHFWMPELNYTGYYNTGYRRPICSICPEDFHKLFPGQRLRKGRRKRVKRILIELED